MKHYSMIKVAALSIVLLAAMAFSCEDHSIPDPDPVSNCNRIDGSPRAVDCEFEYVKAEFYRVDRFTNIPDTVYFGTVTPANPNLAVKEQLYGDWVVSYISQFFYLPLQAKVTIRRIAPAPAGSNTYLLRQDMRVGPPPGETGEYNSKSGWFELEKDEELKAVNINIPVGGTYTYDMTYNITGRFEYNGDYIDYPVYPKYYLLVQNAKTTEMLKATPYNYTKYRDIAEARLPFSPKIIPHVCVPCRQGNASSSIKIQQ